MTNSQPSPEMQRFFETCIFRYRHSGALESFGEDVVDWLATIGRANREFVGPALMTAADDADMAKLLPADVRSYLHLLKAENARRNRLIRAQCQHLGKVINAAGATAVLLKGATWLFEDGPGAQDRMLRDVDALVPAPSIKHVLSALEASGYRTKEGNDIDPNHIHIPPLVHDDHPIGIELHLDISKRPSLLGAAEILAEAIPICDGLSLPSLRHRIAHNVIHARISNGDHSGGALSPRDALDLARLMRLGDTKLDWSDLAVVSKARGYFPQLSGALHLSSAFSGVNLSEPFASDLAGARHAWRCRQQFLHPRLDRILRRIGSVTRALAWERDSYPLQLGERRDAAAHLMVNRRRVERILQAIFRDAGRG